MIGIELARALHAAGVRWDPLPGDRFVIPDRHMDDDIFVVSTMVVDVHDLPDGRIVRFNGTVEWALDTIEQSATLWLPTETQLRDLLGGTFQQLDRRDGRFSVHLRIAERDIVIEGADAEDAYGRALLHLATGTHPRAATEPG